jgi:hypothetical protein
MGSTKAIDFYWEPTERCSIHPDKPSGYVVKRHGEIYRRACTERCAMTQALYLHNQSTVRGRGAR